MRALIQRVHRASVTVDAHCVGEIEHGLLAYIGLGHDDNLQSAQRMIDKILTYRIFDNDDDPAKFGKLDKKSGNEVILKNARRMWYWHAAESISLSAVALYGINQDKSKIVAAVPAVWLEAIELIPASDKAVTSIEGAPNVKAE